MSDREAGDTAKRLRYTITQHMHVARCSKSGLVEWNYGQRSVAAHEQRVTGVILRRRSILLDDQRSTAAERHRRDSPGSSEARCSTGNREQNTLSIRQHAR